MSMLKVQPQQITKIGAERCGFDPKLYAPVSSQNRQRGRAVTHGKFEGELGVQARNKLWMSCNVKNWRQAYGLINAETAILLLCIINAEKCQVL
jgi:hypothetical protein